jgi:predicted ATPase with chaperone activity
MEAAQQLAERKRDIPRAPLSLADVGVRRNVLEGLALKILYVSGEISLLELAQQLRLSLPVVDTLFQRLRKEELCEVTGMIGHIHQIAITAQGRVRAQGLLDVSQYAGPAPVSLEQYAYRVCEQSVRHLDVHADDLKAAFKDLVLDSATLTQLGTALNSGKSIFLYGPTGTGKTTIAETLSRVFAQKRVWIPHAVEVDGQIVTVFDPAVHKPFGDASSDHDARWVSCQRPRILVGGELSIEMLDLQFNPISKFYTGPVQMKANNGLLIVDDFGRQRLHPEELLNRWVVPLDRRMDFLTLAGGKKMEIPFELFVVFATNIDPSNLVDEAFLRRIHTKIRVGAVKEEQFHEIFRRVCQEASVSYDPAVVDELINVITGKLKQPLRACYPRDIVHQIVWAARYEGRKPILDRHSVGSAVANYFLAS